MAIVKKVNNRVESIIIYIIVKIYNDKLGNLMHIYTEEIHNKYFPRYRYCGIKWQLAGTGTVLLSGNWPVPVPCYLVVIGWYRYRVI